MNVNMKWFWGVYNAPPEKRYKNFISSTADSGVVWISNKETLQVWPERVFALRIVSEEEITSLDIHKFCDILSDSSMKPCNVIQVFPTENNYYDVDDQTLLNDMLEELDRI